MSDLPVPFVDTDCDCRDLDGFMLNTERLMASELVALSTHEEVAAAMFLWCRAWKQIPAASLPDDERVLAAFARLPLPRFRKIRDAIMRGFVKCSDGRFYHRFLAEEAMRAFSKKKAFQHRRETDNERLRKWRGKQSETRDETPDETRFVAEGQGQGQVRRISSLRSDIAREGRKAQAELSADCEEFYRAYPRKTGIGAARKAYMAARKKAEHAEIMAGLKRAKFSADPQYIPHPATWLNQERWRDEPSNVLSLTPVKGVSGTW